MFFHIFTYRLKKLLRTKEMIFWTLAFPILLGTFFNLITALFSRRFLFTVAGSAADRFDRRAVDIALETRDHAGVLHAVIDALVDSFFPELTKLDDRIDHLESAMEGPVHW